MQSVLHRTFRHHFIIVDKGKVVNRRVDHQIVRASKIKQSSRKIMSRPAFRSGWYASKENIGRAVPQTLPGYRLGRLDSLRDDQRK